MILSVCPFSLGYWNICFLKNLNFVSLSFSFVSRFWYLILLMIEIHSYCFGSNIYFMVLMLLAGYMVRLITLKCGVSFPVRILINLYFSLLHLSPYSARCLNSSLTSSTREVFPLKYLKLDRYLNLALLPKVPEEENEVIEDSCSGICLYFLVSSCQSNL